MAVAMVFALFPAMTQQVSAADGDPKLQIKFGEETKVITEGEWNALLEQKGQEHDYSSRGRQPNPPTVVKYKGVPLMDLLEAKGIDTSQVEKDAIITFRDHKGDTMTKLTAEALFDTERYCYQLNEQGEDLVGDDNPPVVPAMINDEGRLVLGQSAVHEYNKQYWWKDLFNTEATPFVSMEIPLSVTPETPEEPTPEEPGSGSEGYASGTGTEADPYIISNGEELRHLSEKVNGGETYEGKFFKLSEDIDLASEPFTPIGGGERLEDATPTYKFMGNFDGNNKTIKNLKVESNTNYTGLFGYNQGVIKNLTVEGTVNCTSAAVSGNRNPTSDFVGGVVGFNAGTIQRVLSKVELTAPYSGNVGGIAGFNTSGKWRDNMTTGKDINRTIDGATGLIVECGNEGNIKSYYKVGGLVGENEGFIRNSYNHGNIYVSYTGSGNGQAGIAGRNGCNNQEWGVGHILNCYNTGATNMKALEADPPYFDSRWISGITGFTSKSSTVTNCYTVGTIHKGYKDYAPIAPRGDDLSTLVNNYSLDTIITSVTSDGEAPRNGIRKTEAELKSDAFLSDIGGAFGKDVNNINSGYPILKWQGGQGVAVQSIEADLPAVTKEYVEGQEFDKSSVKFYAVYGDGTKELIPPSNYSISKTDAFTLADNNTQVNLSCNAYGISKSEAVTVSVEAKALESIQVTQAPTKHTYLPGDTFESVGMKVTAKYSNEKLLDREKTEVVQDFTTDTGGALELKNKTVTVSYTRNGVTKTDSFDVVVVDQGTAPEKDSEGTYLIRSADDLIWMSKQVTLLGNGEINAKLMNNIDTGGTEFMPIGTRADQDVTTEQGGALKYKRANFYKGTFDGNGKEVNLNLEGGSYLALIGAADGATIEDLTVKGSLTGHQFVAGVVGYSQNTLTITGCKNQANIGAHSWAAGMVGYGKNVEISNCTNSGTITGSNSNVGGIVGYASGTGNITGCANTGDIKGLESGICGGILGMGGSTSLENCKNTGTITGQGGSRVGGIAGYGKHMTNCGNEGDIVSTSSNVGGIVGYGVSSEIKGCYNTGSVTGKESVGGIVGTGTVSKVENCYNKGKIQAEKTTTSSGVGGIVGTKIFSAIAITNCYNAGTIGVKEGEDAVSVGEIIGHGAGNSGQIATINNTYYLKNDDETQRSIGSSKTGLDHVDNSQPKTLAELSEMAATLGDAYQNSCGGAVFTTQTPIEHTYGEWSEDTATFTEPGSQTRTCSVCGHVERRDTPATGVGITMEAIEGIGTVTLTPECEIKIQGARAN